MYIQVNKDTRRIEGYIDQCVGKPIAEDDCDLIEVENIPNEWEFHKFIDGVFVFDEEFKALETEENEMKNIRVKREVECFPFINRGELWYSLLTDEQRNELKIWYQKWLDAPATKIIPSRPAWLE